MTTGTENINEIFTSIENSTEELVTAISPVDEKDLNIIPFENSWTAAQVVAHVTRVINGMGEALGRPGKISDRNPDAKANDFKTMFLNFETKMKSPVFVLPEHDVYEKDILINKLKAASNNFIETGRTANLSEELNLQPLGNLTKLELLHFILYHTQRHIHQVKNILEKVTNKQINY